MNHTQGMQNGSVADVLNALGGSDIVLVCEHASHFIPPEFNDLGLADPALTSHAAWDPGAGTLAEALSARLDAPLVLSRVSRLVYDCNRPPEAPDATPERSEVFEIPGNRGITDQEKRQRTDKYYKPFQSLLHQTLESRTTSVVVTVHSFTPVYLGQRRNVEIGILHDADTRLADALLSTASDHCTYNVQRNAPYGPQDGVTHTLKEHALPQGRLNVMIEVRNDLLRSPTVQTEMADALSAWITDAVARCEGAK